MNNIISEFMGECRHELMDVGKSGNGCVLVCTCGSKFYVQFGRIDFLGVTDTEIDYMEYHMLAWLHSDYDEIDYTTDPSAWDERVYRKIRESGLWQLYVLHLQEIACGYQALPPYTEKTTFEMLEATSLQKSQALVRAIKESEAK